MRMRIRVQSGNPLLNFTQEHSAIHGIEGVAQVCTDGRITPNRDITHK